MRVKEDSKCREILSQLEWLKLVVSDQDLPGDMAVLEQQAKDYIANFAWGHCRRYPLQCLNARLITVGVHVDF